MSYTSLAKLTAKFGEHMLISLTDRGDVATDAIDTDVIDQALADADAMIDGYVGVRYALPMETTPPLIGSLALAITVYNLHVASPDPKIEEDYKAALRTVRDISGGGVRLPIAGADAPGTGSSGARLTDRERPLTQASMKGFI